MTDSWGSPLWLVAMLAERFGPFDLDAAAERWSAICRRFVTKQQDIFVNPPEADNAWMNPPYSKGNLGEFVPYARHLVLERTWKRGTLLVPHYTSEGWWQHVVRPEGPVTGAEWRFGELPHPLRSWTRYHSRYLTTDVILPAGRLVHRVPPTWRGARESARFASAVVIFSREGVRP